MTTRNPYEMDLDKNPANYQPLSPLTFLERAAFVYPKTTAIIHGDLRIPYDEFYARCRRLASALSKRGIGLGDTVAVIAPNVPAMLDAHYGVMMTGAVLNAINYRLSAQEIAFILDHGEAKVLMVDREFGALAKEALKLCKAKPFLIGIDDHEFKGGELIGEIEYEAFLKGGDPNFAWELPKDEWQAITLNYTSGTTGNPKGALMAQRTLLGNLSGFICSHDFYPKTGDLFWSPADWAWTGGLFDALLPTWHYGMPILGYRGRFDPEKAFWLIEKYGVRNAFLFPTALKMMMKAVPEPKARYDVSLRTIMSGGEAVGETVFRWAQEQLGVSINEIFGQTEMNYVVGGCAAAYPAKPGAMGRPYPGHRVAVLDDAGNVLPPGEVGEVCVQRSCNSEPDPVFLLEYWKNPQATAEKYLGEGMSAWGRTGDLAKMDEDGYLWYQGRADDMFKSAGYRIGPAEIENCLVKHPAVANAAVIGAPDEMRGTFVKAFIVLQPGQTPSAALEAELQAHVRQYLAPYEYPKAIEFIDALPMTTTGKVQRRVLRLREEEQRKT